MIWYLRLAGLLAVLAVGWQVNAWRTEAAAAARLRSDLAQAKADASASRRAQEAASQADRMAAVAAADELQRLRDTYDRLRALPPATLIREVKTDGPCPATALHPEFGVRFDLAAYNPAAAGADPAGRRDAPVSP